MLLSWEHLKYYHFCMIIRRGYKYRLKANKHVRQQFIKNAGACRFIWNKILAINERRYLAGVPRLIYYDAWALVVWWKQSEELKCCRKILPGF